MGCPVLCHSCALSHLFTLPLPWPRMALLRAHSFLDLLGGEEGRERSDPVSTAPLLPPFVALIILNSNHSLQFSGYHILFITVSLVLGRAQDR